MFIHNISLKHIRETTASNLFQASLLCSVVYEFYFKAGKMYPPQNRQNLLQLIALKYFPKKDDPWKFCG